MPAVWTGAINFGMVSIPVALHSAVSEKNVKFNQINKATGNRVKQKRVDAETGEEVAYGDIQKGFEIAPGQFVIIDPEDLEAIKADATKAVDMTAFVPEASIDPVTQVKSYLVLPGDGGANAYALFRDALVKTKRVGVGQIVLRGKEATVVIRPRGEGLSLSTLSFADELNAFEEHKLPGPADKRQLAVAVQLIQAESDQFHHDLIEDNYRAEVMKLIEAKASGGTYEVKEGVRSQQAVPDVMEALQQSLAKAKAPKRKAKKEIVR